MTKQLCDDIYPGTNADLKNVDVRYQCYTKYMGWAGISYDREYCELKTKNFTELYACLDKHKIPRKADYCDFIHSEDSRYFGNNLEHIKCLQNESVPISAAQCNLHLKEDQRALYKENTDFQIEKHLQCLDKHEIPSEIIGCNLKYNKYYLFKYWFDLPIM